LAPNGSTKQMDDSWNNINNTNYAYGQTRLKQSNKNWKYLGQANNLTQCKLKSVEDKNTEYSSIVYTTGNGAYDKTCYGGVKGGTNNPTYVPGITTSLAPNGTTRLGGEAGGKLLKQMIEVQNEIEELIKEQQSFTAGIEKSKNAVKKERLAKNKELEKIITKLDQDRKKINKLINNPDYIAGEEDANDRQYSNYIIYLLWLIIVIISIVLALHLYNTDIENISPITYIFVGVWVLVFLSYYYRQFLRYGKRGWDYISEILVDNV
jgi:hypothetical protein